MTDSENCGKIAYPAIQAAPCFSSCFPHIFPFKKAVDCLIPAVKFDFLNYKKGID